MRMRGAARTGTGWGSDLGRRQGNRAGIAATFAFTLGGRLSTSDASARLALTMRPRRSHGKLPVVSNTDGRVELRAFPGTIRAAPVRATVMNDWLTVASIAAVVAGLSPATYLPAGLPGMVH